MNLAVCILLVYLCKVYGLLWHESFWINEYPPEGDEAPQGSFCALWSTDPATFGVSAFRVHLTNTLQGNSSRSNKTGSYRSMSHMKQRNSFRQVMVFDTFLDMTHFCMSQLSICRHFNVFGLTFDSLIGYPAFSTLITSPQENWDQLKLVAGVISLGSICESVWPASVNSFPIREHNHSMILNSQAIILRHLMGSPLSLASCQNISNALPDKYMEHFHITEILNMKNFNVQNIVSMANYMQLFLVQPNQVKNLVLGMLKLGYDYSPQSFDLRDIMKMKFSYSQDKEESWWNSNLLFAFSLVDSHVSRNDVSSRPQQKLNFSIDLQQSFQRCSSCIFRDTDQLKLSQLLGSLQCMMSTASPAVARELGALYATHFGGFSVSGDLLVAVKDSQRFADFTSQHIHFLHNIFGSDLLILRSLLYSSDDFKRFGSILDHFRSVLEPRGTSSTRARAISSHATEVKYLIKGCERLLSRLDDGYRTWWGALPTSSVVVSTDPWKEAHHTSYSSQLYTVSMPQSILTDISKTGNLTRIKSCFTTLRAFLTLLRKQLPKWLLVIDDDTIVIDKNLRTVLGSKFNSSEPLWISGHTEKKTVAGVTYGLTSSATGLVFSRGLLELFRSNLTGIEKAYRTYCIDPDWGADDTALSKLAIDAKVPITRYEGMTPYTSFDRKYFESNDLLPVSFHCFARGNSVQAVEAYKKCHESIRNEVIAPTQKKASFSHTP